MRLKAYIASVGIVICLAMMCPLPGSAQQSTSPATLVPSPIATAFDQISLSWFQVIQTTGIIIAIIFTLYQFQRLRYDMRESRYLEVGRQYKEFVKQAIRNDGAPVCFDPSSMQHFISSGGTKAELLLYDMLFSTFENAYVLYQNGSKEEKKQWEGWELWIRDYFQNNIRCSLAWEIVGRYYDPAYVKYVTSHFASVSPRVPDDCYRTGAATTIDIRLSPEKCREIEEWAAKESDKPGFNETVRRLIDLGLFSASGNKDT